MTSFLQGSRIIRMAAIIQVVLLSVGVVAYSLTILLGGVPRTVVPESAPGAPAPPGMVQFVPDQVALIPLLAAILLAVGILTGKLQIAWFGLAALVIFGTLFIFGIGGPVFLPAVVLLVLVTIIQISKRESNNPT